MFSSLGLMSTTRYMYTFSKNKSRTLPKLLNFQWLKFVTFCTNVNYSESFLSDPTIQNYLNNKSTKLNELPDKEKSNVNISQLLRLFDQRINLRSNLEALFDLEKEHSSDVDFKNGIEEEKNIYTKQLLKTECKIIESLISENEEPPCSGVLFEISPGVGGQEAMLFAKTLYDMYCNYIEFKGWTLFVAEVDLSNLGGLRHASLLVEGHKAYSSLIFESGVHRVQRVPSTEKSGRVHTSTVTVAVIPQPDDVSIVINERDLIIETKRSSGAGGQHVNTTDSAVRITHLPSGIVVECQTERSQIRNRGIALARLKAKLYQQQLDDKNNTVRYVRKSQIGIGARSDKIRTYNFHQDRITDHRLSGNIHNLSEFFNGNSVLDQLINDLITASNKNKFNSFISDIKNKKI